MDQLKFAEKQLRCRARLMFGLTQWETDPLIKKQRKKNVRNVLTETATKNVVSTGKHNITAINTDNHSTNYRSTTYIATCKNQQQEFPEPTTLNSSTPLTSCTHRTHAIVDLGVQKLIKDTNSGRENMIDTAIQAACYGYVAACGPKRSKATHIIKSFIKYCLKRIRSARQETKK